MKSPGSCVQLHTLPMLRNQFILRSPKKLCAMKLYGLSVSVGDLLKFRSPFGEKRHGEAQTTVFTALSREALHASDLRRPTSPVGQHLASEVGFDAPSYLCVCFASAETLALGCGFAPNFERVGGKDVEPRSISLVTVLAVVDDARLHCLQGA